MVLFPRVRHRTQSVAVTPALEQTKQSVNSNRITIAACMLPLGATLVVMHRLGSDVPSNDALVRTSRAEVIRTPPPRSASAGDEAGTEAIPGSPATSSTELAEVELVIRDTELERDDGEVIALTPRTAWTERKLFVQRWQFELDHQKIKTKERQRPGAQTHGINRVTHSSVIGVLDRYVREEGGARPNLARILEVARETSRWDTPSRIDPISHITSSSPYEGEPMGFRCLSFEQRHLVRTLDYGYPAPIDGPSLTYEEHSGGRLSGRGLLEDMDMRAFRPPYGAGVGDRWSLPHSSLSAFLNPGGDWEWEANESRAPVHVIDIAPRGLFAALVQPTGGEIELVIETGPVAQGGSANFVIRVQFHYRVDGRVRKVEVLESNSDLSRSTRSTIYGEVKGEGLLEWSSSMNRF
ncbi:MAG: hypothetical protein ACI841_001785, partial [Planctomycetota bacterium]